MTHIYDQTKRKKSLRPEVHVGSLSIACDLKICLKHPDGQTSLRP